MMGSDVQKFKQNGRGAPAKNLTGLRFGRLKVVGPARQRMGRTWMCECKCGNRVEVSTSNLRQGNTKSCGCLRNHARKAALPGMTPTKKFAAVPIRPFLETPPANDNGGKLSETEWLALENFVEPGTKVDVGVGERTPLDSTAVTAAPTRSWWRRMLGL